LSDFKIEGGNSITGNIVERDVSTKVNASHHIFSFTNEPENIQKNKPYLAKMLLTTKSDIKYLQQVQIIAKEKTRFPVAGEVPARIYVLWEYPDGFRENDVINAKVVLNKISEMKTPSPLNDFHPKFM